MIKSIVCDVLDEEDPKVQQNLIWAWAITAREPGTKTLLLTIFLPVSENDKLEVKQTRNLRSFTINIDVLVTPTSIPTALPTFTPRPPTPTPTPTPSVIERVGNTLIDDSATTISALLSFLIGGGTLLIAILSYRRQKNQAGPETPAILDNRVQLFLLQILDEYFSEQELRDLCFQLGIDYDDLPFSGQRNKARELIAYATRQGRLKKLSDEVRKERPHLFSQDM